MLRSKADGGWWLITHPDHAHLAGDFAKCWGSDLFPSPEPREHVLRGIYSHDDGWRARDAHPVLTRQGYPAAFSTELVGKYAAFEDIDLSAYLAVRREAGQRMALEDPYAAILISMHTCNLLSERADRSSIREEELPSLDAFLAEQTTLQTKLRSQLVAAGLVPLAYLEPATLFRHFQLLQACDNLSLLSCVDFDGQATLLHPFTTRDGVTTDIQVQRIGKRIFRLSPYPFSQPQISLTIPSRFVPKEIFTHAEDLHDSLSRAEIVRLPVFVTS